MRNYLVLFVIFVISLISSVSSASQWTFIGADDKGNNWAVDKSSIVSVGRTLRAWKRIDFKERQPYPPNGELIQHVYFLDVVNCTNHQVGVKASRLMRIDGSVIATHEDKDESIQWQTVAPDTVVEKTMMYVCSNAPKAAK
ncbi:MAG: hypothetical protein K8H84_03245 [Sulfuricella denitrificans]|nr:hypothetical protein [Sulfuricella denitrificans]